MIPKPIETRAQNLYKIWVKYEDNTEGEVDLSHLKNKPIFEPWRDLTFFKSVYIDKKTNAISWDENIQLCPNNIYLKIKGMSFEEWKQNQNMYATN
jgi:hypothetical protein